MMSKGRKVISFGENHTPSKLTDEKVRKIKELLSLGVTVTRLSKDFNISHGALHAIKKGVTWKHVTI